MRTSFFATLALPVLALAAPLNDGKAYENDQVDAGQQDHTYYPELLKMPFFDFTSHYEAYATPDQPVNANNTKVPGQENAYGTFKYAINAPLETICYNITVFVAGNYSSPAKTATHIHEAGVGMSGPPRIAFPNPTITSPVDEFGRRISIGCLVGPFTTGLAPMGTDTGANFSLSQIEASPASFFTDVHTEEFLAGAIRGQLRLTETIY